MTLSLNQILFGGALIIFLGMAGYIVYANDKIDDQAVTISEQKGQIKGLNALTLANEQVAAKTNEANAHERDIIAKINEAPDTNACAGSPSIRVVIDAERVRAEPR